MSPKIIKILQKERTKTMLWENLREEEFVGALEKSNKVCAIAIGCLEMHGQHLPLGTDTLKTAKILEMAAEREPVVIFPHMYLGCLLGARSTKIGDKGFKYGYVGLSAEMLLALLEEICDEIGRNGFTKIVLVSGHGGNAHWLGYFLSKIRGTKKPYDVFFYRSALVKPNHVLDVIEERGRDYFPKLTDSDMEVLEEYVREGKYDGHAGYGETAMVMGTYPELVRLDRCEALNGLSTHVSDDMYAAGLDWGGSWGKNYPNAYCGHAPIGVTQEIADASVEIAVQNLVKALQFLKDDEKVDKVIK